MRLFRDLARTAGGLDNVVLAPVSVDAVLQVLAHGANGPTRVLLERTYDGANRSNAAQLRAAFGREVTFVTATSLWAAPRVDVALAFREQVARCCDVETLHFDQSDAVGAVNRWVAKATGGHIQAVLAGLPPAVALVLVNAVHLQAPWVVPFEAARPRMQAFTRGDGRARPIATMTRAGTFAYTKNDAYEWVRLPYRGDTLVMDVFLPAPGHSLETLAADLLADPGLPAPPPAQALRGRVTMPSFAIATRHDLKAALTDVGLGALFDPRTADFSRMVNAGPGLALDEIRHSVYLRVDETGTEAAAATSVTMIGSLPPPALAFDLRVDRPFLIAIRSIGGGTLLLLAAVNDPG